MYPELPVELVVSGYPVSQQVKIRARLQAWKEDVEAQARAQMPAGHFALEDLLTVTVYFFPRADLEPDIDNAAKPILDALTACVFVDDKQIERLVVQRFEPGRLLPAGDTVLLEKAFDAEGPAVYIRIDAVLKEEEAS